MNWYKIIQSGKSQKDFHKRMIRHYRRKKIEVERLMRKHRRRGNDSGARICQKRLEKFEKRLYYHFNKIYYYQRQEEKQKMKDEFGVSFL